MDVLVINCGSSSLKFQLIDTESGSVPARGLCERIGIEGSAFEYRRGNEDKQVRKIPMKDHEDAVAAVLSMLTDSENGVVSSLSEIEAVGHRVVHGGERFKDAVRIDEGVISEIEKVSPLAPLHNPAALSGIRACMHQMPDTPQTAVFDTAFHQTMGPEAYLYAIPYEYYDKYRIRRYGFHGTSHEYVAHRTAAILDRDIEDLKLIICHLGNGASVSAVKNGKCVDTSMGFTPLAGLVMGTRSGDLDPSVITYLMEQEGMSAHDVLAMLNKSSGMLGLSGISSDYRDIVEAAGKGSERAKTAIDAFVTRVVKYIGAYMAEMDGADAVVFTAGAGENNTVLRGRIAERLAFMGAHLDRDKNAVTRGVEADIGTPGDGVKLLVVPTNEELAIAEQTVELLET